MRISKKKITALIMVCIFIMSLPSVFVNADYGTPDFETNTESLLLVDTSNDDVIYSSNSDEKRCMASTTKIMTYIVAVENIKDPENTYIEIEEEPISHYDWSYASTAGFENHIGEKYSALDILYGLMLPSGCEAAEVLAYYVGKGNVRNFIDMMNAKAKKLGCENTHYSDCHGMSDENHYSTAEDTYKIAKYALSLPYFREIVKTEAYYIEGYSYPVINTNYLVDEVNGGKYYYQYAEGVKTGFTSLAGKCLVSIAKKGDKEFMCVALGGKYTSEDGIINHAMVDSINLYKWAFANFTDNVNVELDHMYRSVEIGQSLDLGFTADDNAVINWESSDETIATVDENGVVTAKSLGQVKIVACTQTGNKDVCYVSCGFYNGINADFAANINWGEVRRAGIDYVYIDYSDNDLVSKIEQAAANGIAVGIKFSPGAFSSVPETEAENKKFAEEVLRYKMLIKLPVMYDLAALNLADDSELTYESAAAYFAADMEQIGLSAICFGKKSFYKNINVNILAQNNAKISAAYYPYMLDFSAAVNINNEYPADVWVYRTDGYIPQLLNYSGITQSAMYMSSVQIDDTVCGDLNNDGIVTVIDVRMLQMWLSNKQVRISNTDSADLNGDGKVNVFDLVILKRIAVVDEQVSSVYADPAMWAYLENEPSEKQADVFFVCPTVYMGQDKQWTEFDDKTKSSFVGAINMEKGIYDADARFFAPYYHQASFSAYSLPEDEFDSVMENAYSEVKDAFLYYMENYNKGRPVILAGFSQGADLSIRLLKDCFKDDKTNEQLIACYAVGWRITEQEITDNPHIKYAMGETDTGVLITFNSEDPSITDSMLIPEGTKTLAINPLNWKTDGTPADKSLNKGACFTNYDGSIRSEIPELTGAYIDNVRGALKMTDINTADYPGILFGDGIYHIYDYQFFYRNLQENVQKRIDSYMSK